MGQDANGKPRYVQASQWLSANRAAEQMTWAPGEPELIGGRVIADGRWVQKDHVRVLNLYRPPIVTLGDPEKAQRWADYWKAMYPNDVEHILDCLAHCVQNPAVKINHGLVLGGLQGIGKDTALEPVKHAVGHWNWAEESPPTIMGRFNPYVRSVVLRINEGRDAGEHDRYAFYERRKTLMAAPPDVHSCDEKHARPYSVQNVCFVVVTTNNKDGLYLPADDRRHFVAWSGLAEGHFKPDYFDSLYRWYEREGVGHVAAYLLDRDISEFNPKAPPPKTVAFWDMVDANRPSEDAALADVLEKLGDPAAVTIERIASLAEPEFAVWLKTAKNIKAVRGRMASAGYERQRNLAREDGRWRVGKNNHSVYVRRELNPNARAAAIDELRAAWSQ